jgi:3-isopropylmalate/(R)-2-methylmalate dehydratase small subunit
MTAQSNQKSIHTLKGRAVPMGGDDIDTDRIIPARYLLCTTFAGLGEHAFEDDRKDAGHAFSDSRYAGAKVLITGRNFGCGSSREHAPQALRRWGIEAVIGESFAEIFLDNATSCGMACVCLTRDRIEKLLAEVRKDSRTEITVDLEHRVIEQGAERHPLTMIESVRQRLRDGTWDILSVLQEAQPKVDALAAQLPYLKFQGPGVRR